MLLCLSEHRRYTNAAVNYKKKTKKYKLLIEILILWGTAILFVDRFHI